MAWAQHALYCAPGSWEVFLTASDCDDAGLTVAIAEAPTYAAADQVYVYARSSTSGSFSVQGTFAGEQVGANFGHTYGAAYLTGDGNILAVTSPAYYVIPGFRATGRTYVYRRTGSTWGSAQVIAPISTTAGRTWWMDLARDGSTLKLYEAVNLGGGGYSYHERVYANSGGSYVYDTSNTWPGSGGEPTFPTGSAHSPVTGDMQFEGGVWSDACAPNEPPGPAWVENRWVPETYTSTLPVTITSTQVTGSSTLPVTITSWAPAFTLDDGQFDATITLDGNDITEALIGPLNIKIGSGAARIATFVYAPESGAINPAALVGVTVEIDILVGAARTPYRRFTGRVARPELDLQAGLITITATDGLQAAVDALSNSQIDTLTPAAYWSPHTGDPLATGWDYLQERLLGWPGDVDMDAYGVLRATAWAGRSLFRTLDDGDIYDTPPLEVRLAERDQIINTVVITLDYRYPSLALRRCHWQWDMEDTVHGGLTLNPANNTIMVGYPEAAVITQAAESTGWELRAHTLTSLCSRYPTGTYGLPPNEVAWLCTTPTQIVAAELQLDLRYDQTITERYTITLQATGSISQVGVLQRDYQFSLESDYDAQAWIDDATLAPVVTLGTSTGETRADGTEGVDGSRSEATQAINTALRLGVTAIKGSQRAHRIIFHMPTDPTLDTTVALRLETVDSEIQGAVVGIDETYDFSAGQFEAVIELAISHSGGTQPIETALTPPAAPSKPAPALTGLTPYGETQIYAFSGRQDTLDDDVGGWLYNYGGGTVGSRFLVDAPAIPDADVQPLTLTAAATYDVAIPQDDFSLTVL